MKKVYKKFKLISQLFKPCASNPSWLISRWDVTLTNTNKSAVYVFGADVMQATVYESSHPDFGLDDLAYDALIRHLEKNPDDFDVGLFRFEFDGEQFNFCKVEPKWADYDCGIIED